MESKSRPKRKSIARLALWGLFGSAAGAVAGFPMGWVVHDRVYRMQRELFFLHYGFSEFQLIVYSLVGVFVSGAGIAIALGLATKKRGIPLITLASAFGFAIALLVSTNDYADVWVLRQLGYVPSSEGSLDTY